MKNLFSFALIIYSFVGCQSNLDDLPINQIQLIGSHNSYKIGIDTNLFRYITQKDTHDMKGLEYSHIELTQQLDLGLRNLELDVYSDTMGGKYAHPLGFKMVKNQPPFDPQNKMAQAGFKVFHMQDIDFRSHYLLFRDNLIALKNWSDTHPTHEPIFITMNAKDDVSRNPDFTIPEAFTPHTFDLLEEELKTYLGVDKLITPAQIQGTYPSVEDAVLHFNWTKLKDARGKFIFIVDEVGDKRAAFIQNHPSLKGRVMFVNAEAGTPEAAILIINNPLKDGQKIAEYVKKGYIVRTRADAETKQARKNDYSQFEAAKASWAQIITTDYYQKSSYFPSTYIVSFEGNKYVRKNPNWQ